MPWRTRQVSVPRLASLAAIVVLAVVAGIRMSSAPVATPAAPAEPLLPVAVGPAEQALHQSGLRCAEIDTGLECTRRLSDGWRQVARLEVAGGAVQGLEVRLVPGTAAFPVVDAPAALSEPADDVLGVHLAEVVDQAVAADGLACDCTRPVEGGGVHVEGDPLAGYLLTLEASGTPRGRTHVTAEAPALASRKTHSTQSRAWLQPNPDHAWVDSSGDLCTAVARSSDAVTHRQSSSSIFLRAPAPVAATSRGRSIRNRSSSPSATWPSSSCVT